MKVVLDTRPRSGYADTEELYQFPDRYLKHAMAAQGDWVVLYEPRREGGRAAYVAAARLVSVLPDPIRPKHHLARLEERLPFDAPVPLRGLSGYHEEPLRKVRDPREVGRALQGRSVRPLAEADFMAIVLAGLAQTILPANHRRLDLDEAGQELLASLNPPVLAGRLERVLSNRLVRNASFRGAVLNAYDDTCAMTGIKLVDGGGRPEAQAAHIVPVAEGGPDVVQNGIALSATVHWLFDRHLISIGEDWSLLIAPNRVPERLKDLMKLHADRIGLPRDRRLWPNSHFVAHHRKRYAALSL